MQKVREAECGFAGGAGEHNAARAEEIMLAKKVVDQETIA